MNRLKLFFGFIIFLNIVSCASVQSVSLTPIPKQRTKVVRAEASKFIFLGFNFNNDFVDQVVEQMKEQCADGIVSGILTKDEVIHYFLAHTRKVTATGYCIDSNSKQAQFEVQK